MNHFLFQHHPSPFLKHQLHEKMKLQLIFANSESLSGRNTQNLLYFRKPSLKTNTNEKQKKVEFDSFAWESDEMDVNENSESKKVMEESSTESTDEEFSCSTHESERRDSNNENVVVNNTNVTDPEENISKTEVMESV